MLRGLSALPVNVVAGAASVVPLEANPPSSAGWALVGCKRTAVASANGLATTEDVASRNDSQEVSQPDDNLVSASATFGWLSGFGSRRGGVFGSRRDGVGCLDVGCCAVDPSSLRPNDRKKESASLGRLKLDDDSSVSMSSARSIRF